MTLNRPFRNAPIMPIAVLHAHVQSHFNSGRVCTNSLAPVASNRFSSDLSVSSFASSRVTRLGASSSVMIASFALSLSRGSSCTSLMVRLGTGLEL